LSTTWAKLRQMENVGISVLAATGQATAWAMAGDASERFAGTRWRSTPTGSLFLEPATAMFDCRAVIEVDAGDHWIVLFQVLSVAVVSGTLPLVYMHGRLGVPDPTN